MSLSEISQKKKIGKYTVRVSMKPTGFSKLKENDKELGGVLTRIKGLLVEPKEVECTRCGAKYDKEKHGNVIKSGQLGYKFTLVVVDENANEAVFYCTECNHLFLTPTSKFIRVTM